MIKSRYISKNLFQYNGESHIEWEVEEGFKSFKQIKYYPPTSFTGDYWLTFEVDVNGSRDGITIGYTDGKVYYKNVTGNSWIEYNGAKFTIDETKKCTGWINWSATNQKKKIFKIHNIEEVNYISFSLYPYGSNKGSAPAGWKNGFKIQIEQGDEATDYVPYLQDIKNIWTWVDITNEIENRENSFYKGNDLYENSREYIYVGDVRNIIDKYGLQRYKLTYDCKVDVAGTAAFYTNDSIFAKYGFYIGTTYTTEWDTYSTEFTPTISNYWNSPNYLNKSNAKAVNHLAFYGVYNTGRLLHIRNIKLEALLPLKKVIKDDNTIYDTLQFDNGCVLLTDDTNPILI